MGKTLNVAAAQAGRMRYLQSRVNLCGGGGLAGKPSGRNARGWPTVECPVCGRVVGQQASYTDGIVARHLPAAPSPSVPTNAG